MFRCSVDGSSAPTERPENIEFIFRREISKILLFERKHGL